MTATASIATASVDSNTRKMRLIDDRKMGIMKQSTTSSSPAGDDDVVDCF